MVGPPLQDGFALVLGVPPDDVPRAVAAYRAHYSAGALLDATAYPGVPELLAALTGGGATLAVAPSRSEEHTSEPQSRQYLVCRLLLEKTKDVPVTSKSHHNRHD